MKTMILSEKICLKRNYLNSTGSSIWSVSPVGNSKFPIFSIHVSESNVLSLKFFNTKRKTEATFVDAKYAAIALHKLCEFLISQGGKIPSIYFKDSNKYLYLVAKLSGMKIDRIHATTIVMVYRK